MEVNKIRSSTWHQITPHKRASLNVPIVGNRESGSQPENWGGSRHRTLSEPYWDWADFPNSPCASAGKAWRSCCLWYRRPPAWLADGALRDLWQSCLQVRGERHGPVWYLTFNLRRGRTTGRISAENVAEVRHWIENYHKVKDQLERSPKSIASCCGGTEARPKEIDESRKGQSRRSRLPLLLSLDGRPAGTPSSSITPSSIHPSRTFIFPLKLNQFPPKTHPSSAIPHQPPPYPQGEEGGQSSQSHPSS